MSETARDPSFERDEAVRPYRVRLNCECGGEYEFTGNVLTMNPPRYEHRCDTCHLVVTPHTRYPHIAWETLA